MINARFLSHRQPKQYVDMSIYHKTSLNEMCLKSNIKKRITSDILPNYWYTFETNENYITNQGYFAGCKSLKGLPENIFFLRLLEIYAFSFLDYAVRECICNRKLFTTPIINDYNIEYDLNLKKIILYN